MTTSKRSSLSAKSGNAKPDRQKGLAYYKSMLTLVEHEGNNKTLANNLRAIIKCLEQRLKDEKEK